MPIIKSVFVTNQNILWQSKKNATNDKIFIGQSTTYLIIRILLPELNIKNIVLNISHSFFNRLNHF